MPLTRLLDLAYLRSRDDGERINYVSDELQHDSIVRFRLASSTYVDRMIDIGLFF